MKENLIDLKTISQLLLEEIESYDFTNQVYESVFPEAKQFQILNIQK